MNNLRSFLIGLLFIGINHCFSQKEANFWCFGTYNKIDFNSGAPVVCTTFGCASAINTIEGCSSVSSRTTGQLLFYTDGINVWRKNNVVMPNGDSLWGSSSTTQSALIVPLPGDTTIYYIFTLDAEVGSRPYSSGYKGLAYSIVDMKLSTNKGDISLKNQPLLTPATEKITGIQHCNGKDFWIVVHEWNTDAFYAYPFTSAGVGTPVISNVGPVYKDEGDTTNYGETIGQMKSSPDGKKIALASYEPRSLVEIYDFCNSNGIVSNPLIDSTYKLFPGYLYGLAFSPDNSKLYVDVIRDTSQLFQYNMNAGSGAAIIASKQLVASNVISMAALQLGPDGKIYVAHSFTQYLGAINNPNALGVACGYVNNAVNMNTGFNNFSQLGLPTVLNAGVYHTLGKDTIMACPDPGSPPQMVLDIGSFSSCGGTSYLWSTGDTTQSISINKTDKYWVNVSGCLSDTINVVSLCPEDSIFVPNVFTPNGDGSNDKFIISNLGYKNVRCEIYDRWGLKLYEWNATNGGWDGRTSSGKEAPDGTYYYVAVATKYDDEISEYHGFLQLLREK